MTDQPIPPTPTGTIGCVIVNEFIAPSVFDLIRVIVSHRIVAAAVRRHGAGLVDHALAVDWRHRTATSVSLWVSAATLYSIGNVREHVWAARMTSRLGIQTRCSYFSLSGTCVDTMYGHVSTSESPPWPSRERPLHDFAS